MRIKGTNTIVEYVDLGTLINGNKGIMCRHSDGSLEVIPGNCLVEIENVFDWLSFRAEAAKDILCATLSGEIASGATGLMKEKGNIVEASIEIADELIKQLKEKEE